MEDKKSEGADEFKPGATIHPGDQPDSAPVPDVAAPTTLPDEPQPAPTVEAIPTGLKPTEPEQGSDDVTDVAWTASEFIDHSKSFDWYLGLAVVSILSAAVLYFLFRDVISSVTPLVAALALGIYARRQPRQLQYHLDAQGLSIGEKVLPYDLFRSFSVIDEGPFASLILLPLKRFGMLTTVYLDPQDEDRIINLVSQYLPMEPRTQDPLDRFMKRIRF